MSKISQKFNTCVKKPYNTRYGQNTLLEFVISCQARHIMMDEKRVGWI